MIEARKIEVEKQEYRPGFAIPWDRVSLYAVFVVFILVVLVPVYWMVRSSFGKSPELHTLPLIYFPTLTLQNFQLLTQQIPFFQYVFNSLAFAISTTFLTLVASFLAAYAFARIQFPGSGVILWIL